jgi:hypothetical protein
MSYGYQPYSYQNTYVAPSYAQRGYAAPPQMQGQPAPMPQIQQQPIMQVPSQPMPQPQMDMPVQDIRFVTSEEAKAFIVMPNTRVLLIDRHGGIAHLKTADNMGQSATQMFRFEPITQDGVAQTSQPQIDLGAYVRREEIKQFGFVTMEQYNALAEELEALKKSLSAPKQNTRGEPQKGGQQ